MGENNGSYGKHWYTNGESQILCVDSEKPDGWVKGYSDARKNIARNINLGKQFSDEHKDKIHQSLIKNPSMGMLNKHQSAYQKLRASETHKGKVLSEETRIKISNTLKETYRNNPKLRLRKPLSDAHKQALSKAHKGRQHKPLSEETKHKIGLKNHKNYIGTVVVNDGKHIYHILPEELDEYIVKGYNRGYIHPCTKSHNKGKICINNGVSNKYIYESELQNYIDKGYIKGQLKSK